MITAAEAKQLLIEGNARYVGGQPAEKNISAERRKELVTNGQHPFAVIVTCSDSRVPAEIIFDQALGDIFVIRVAGNVLDDAALGSVEYAVDHLHSPLVVVMGHEHCGAVGAAVAGGHAPGKVGAIVERILPSLEKAKADGCSEQELGECVCNNNIDHQLALLGESPIIKELLAAGGLVVGAKYFLTSGKVEFFV